MTELNDIFNRPKNQDAEKTEHLFDWRRPARYKDDVGLINRILKNAAMTHHGKRNVALSNYVRSRNVATDRRQRVMIKMHYYRTLKSHQKYIKDYMVQASKESVLEKPELFGMPIEEYEKAMVPLNFKFIISPENPKINNEDLARSFIWKLEQMTGYEFYWMGAVHTDTEHPHSHIVINGKDKHGKSVRFPKDFIKLTMPDIVRNAATMMIGERTHEEIELAKRRAVTSLRWTVFDEDFKKIGSRIYTRNLGMNHQNRLAYLTQIGLAEKGNGYYSLSSDCEMVLRTSGRYNSFFEEYMKANSLPLELYAGGKLEGVVEREIMFDRDESWNDAIIVRAANRRVYVPVYQLQRDNLERKRIEIDVPKGDGKFVLDRDIKVVKAGGREVKKEIER